MLAGLPWTAWLLISLSTVPALAAALAFYLAHGRTGSPPPTPDRVTRLG
jgi:hypothetical protein